MGLVLQMGLDIPSRDNQLLTRYPYKFPHQPLIWVLCRHLDQLS